MSRLTSSLIAKRGLTAWLAFGAAGLATGAVWASGFATSTGANRAGGTVESPALAKTAAGDATSALNGKATAVSPLKFDWDGRWGSIDANTVMFKVNLAGAAFANKDYNVATLVANTSHLSGWASLQLKIDQVQVAPGDPCVAADLTNSADAKILNVDDQDAGVYWNGLRGRLRVLHRRLAGPRRRPGRHLPARRAGHAADGLPVVHHDGRPHHLSTERDGRHHAAHQTARRPRDSHRGVARALHPPRPGG